MKYSGVIFAFNLFLSLGAYGSTIVSVQSAAALTGGTGSFDVSLTNAGPSSIVVGAFTFGLSTTNTAISFTGANTSTLMNSYIFAGNSLFGPDLTGLVSGQSLSVSDVFSTPFAGAVVSSGATVDLGHVLFSVASNSATGPFTTMLLVDPATSLSDPSGNSIVINTLNSGTILVGSSSVPEPSSTLLLLAGVPLFLLRHWLRRKLQPAGCFAA